MPLTVHLGHWSRFVVKQAHDTLQPKRTFNRQNSALKSTELYDSGPRRPYVPVHNHTSTRYGWTWYEMGFFVHWTPPNSTTVICFDLPKHLQASIRLALARVTDDIDFGDPYAVLAVLLNEVLCLYDDSVWSLRNHISNWEVVRYGRSPWLLRVTERVSIDKRNQTMRCCMKLRGMRFTLAKLSQLLSSLLRTCSNNITLSWRSTFRVIPTGIESRATCSFSSTFLIICFLVPSRTVPELGTRCLWYVSRYKLKY